MSEVKAEPDGSFLLIENHCPILRNRQHVPGLLPVRARIVSGRIRRRNINHAAGSSSLRRAALCLSGDKFPNH
jgi:hypothetical protein